MNLSHSLLTQSVYHQTKIEKSVNSYIQHYLDQKCQKNFNFFNKQPLAAVFAGSLTNEEKLRLCARALSDASHAMIALTVGASRLPKTLENDCFQSKHAWERVFSIYLCSLALDRLHITSREVRLILETFHWKV